MATMLCAAAASAAAVAGLMPAASAPASRTCSGRSRAAIAPTAAKKAASQGAPAVRCSDDAVQPSKQVRSADSLQQLLAGAGRVG